MIKHFFKFNRIVLFTAISFSLFNCQDDMQATTPVDNLLEFISPLPQHNVYTPIDNPSNPEKIALGKTLFWDPILSGNKDVACATCHHPDAGYADDLQLSIGVKGSGFGANRDGSILAKRNANTILNTAFSGIDTEGKINPNHTPMFWDNRANSLEEQAIGPILSKEEMRGSDISEDEILEIVISRLKAIPEYQEFFKKSFGSEGINEDRIAKAIASFERTLIANNSPFDRYMRGDSSAMTTSQIDGMNAFINIGCADCHNGPMFSDYQPHILGVPDNSKLPDSDLGDGNYAFRTPTLRNLNLTGPYMHNGVQSSLNDVMNFYEDISQGEGNINKHLDRSQIDPLARDLNMDGDGGDINALIISFLTALEDDSFDKTIPQNVPSGLAVGGNIH